MLKKIHTFVIETTRNELNETGNSVYIAKKYGLSRNLISQYLNTLFSEGKLIKIMSRPVVFFDVKTIEELYGIHVKVLEYKSMQEFREILNPKELQDFDKLIGVNESLQNTVKQCKATISYPPNGLPMLLYGPTGTGKSLMAQLMYEYAINQSLIQKDKQFLIVNCSEYANNPELLTANLFGHRKGAFTGADKDNPGLIKLAQDGILFLDEVHCLKTECQEKLFLFMDKGVYHMVGDNEKWYYSKVRMIFATTEKPEDVLLQTLLRRIPITITIPSLEERTIQERIQLIYTIFESEERRISRRIYISTLVYQILIKTSFPANIGELKNAIQASCVHALFASSPEETILEIRAYDLPEELMERTMRDRAFESEKQKMIHIHELQKFIQLERPIIRFHQAVLQAFEHRQEDFYKQSFRIITTYYEDIIHVKKKHFVKYDYVQGAVQPIFETMSTRYGFTYVNNDILAISAYINDYMRNNVELNNWQVRYKAEVTRFTAFLKQERHTEYCIILEFVEHLQANLDIEVCSMVINILCLKLKMLQRIPQMTKRIGIIIAHGFSTASSIADAVNKLLGRYIFDAIDMPLHVSTQAIIEQLNLYVAKVSYYEEIFLLVDMGSLEDIYKGLNIDYANVGIMNNVSTRVALEIGQGICQDTPMCTIFEQAKAHNDHMFHIIKQKVREKVILCSCASGIGTAKKLRKILVDALPSEFPIKVLTYDYMTLLEKKTNDVLFETYEVICIIGTLNPCIQGIRFIPIEDLIINDTLDELNIYFNEYIKEAGMIIFKQNIIKNFSLSNIMNNLTILNPNKLLEHVAEALDILQSSLHMRFTNRTCFGLYVHICCLIERLVIHKSIEMYNDEENFEDKELAFIQSVKKAFSVVELYYSVDIPVAEIGYIFNYVKNN